MTDCLTFRRKLLEDPSRHDDDLAQHEQACSSCAGFAASLRADEAKLHQALNAAVPPPELTERIQLAISFGAEAAPKPRRRQWLNIAAAGVLAVTAGALGWLTLQQPHDELSLERSVLHHVADETRHLYDPGPADAKDLHTVFERFGAKVSEQGLGQVSFAGICMMRRNQGVHLVLRGEQGPVTVFFMPGEQTTKSMTLDSERFAGVIEPTTWGSIAVVGEHGEALNPVLKRLRSAVNWPAERIGAAHMTDVSRFS